MEIGAHFTTENFSVYIESVQRAEEVGYKYAMDTMNKQLQDNELLKSALLI